MLHNVMEQPSRAAVVMRLEVMGRFSLDFRT
jgi:hypothetical protein